MTSPGSTPNKAFFATPYDVRGQGIGEEALETVGNFKLIIKGLWYLDPQSQTEILSPATSIATNAVDTFLSRLQGSTNNQGILRTIVFPGAAPSLSIPISSLNAGESRTTNIVTDNSPKTVISVPPGLVVPDNAGEIQIPVPNQFSDISWIMPGQGGQSFASYIIGYDFALSSSSFFIVPIASGSVPVTLTGPPGSSSGFSVLPVVFLESL